MSLIVAKIGSSSLTDTSGAIVPAAIDKLCAEVAALRARGDRVVIVSSGAIAAGLPFVGRSSGETFDLAVLQAVSAVGQAHLVGHYNRALAEHSLVGGQVLLAPLDFINRQQYLHARQTLRVLLDLGVVPIVNENDAVADDEIRYGDNDRLAALVANLLKADVLVMLTDTPGMLTGDPRVDEAATLIEEIVAVDQSLEALAGGAGVRGSGGMVSKLAAAKIAAWSGVRAVIASASRSSVLVDAVDGIAGVGTVVQPREQRLSARKLWIAFAVGSSGTIIVDEGARTALTSRGVSLLPAGVVNAVGDFHPDDAVELAGPDGAVFAKGLSRHQASRIRSWAGRRTVDLPEDVPHEVVHRDDLVILPS